MKMSSYIKRSDNHQLLALCLMVLRVVLKDSVVVGSLTDSVVVVPLADSVVVVVVGALSLVIAGSVV